MTTNSVDQLWDRLESRRRILDQLPEPSDRADLRRRWGATQRECAEVFDPPIAQRTFAGWEASPAPGCDDDHLRQYLELLRRFQAAGQ